MSPVPIEPPCKTEPKPPTPTWKSALIGLAVGLGIVIATAPLGFYMAIGRDGELKRGAAAIVVLWLVVLALATVAGAVAPRVLRSIDDRRKS